MPATNNRESEGLLTQSIVSLSLQEISFGPMTR